MKLVEWLKMPMARTALASALFAVVTVIQLLIGQYIGAVVFTAMTVALGAWAVIQYRDETGRP
jgi:uncharacterized protein (DUF697 family)